MSDPIEKIDTFVVSIPRDVPYLGPLGPGESVNERGYIVRKGNGTIYPTSDRSVLVRIETRSGIVGWGETYGICAPKAVCEIVQDLLAPVIKGRDPADVEDIWDELYDLMRVRGFFGGFYVDAIAALDIAMWDAKARGQEQPLVEALGGQARSAVPGYISGLPGASLEEKVNLALALQKEGFNSFKFAAVVSNDGVEEEMRALRAALGPDAKLMVDLHWKYSPEEAIALIKRLSAHDLAFAEAPVKPEDIRGLAQVTSQTDTSIAGGEEWRTIYEAGQRVEVDAVNIIQPEMGHTGVTQFMRICRLAEAHNLEIAPHATIGIGIFLAASIHASAAIKNLRVHEYQHSIVDRNAKHISGVLKCRDNSYEIPAGTGLGVAPAASMFEYAEQYS